MPRARRLRGDASGCAGTAASTPRSTRRASRRVIDAVKPRRDRGGRGLPGARLRRTPSTSSQCARASLERECPGAVGDALARDRARVARVRARVDRGAERLRRAARRGLPRATSRTSSARRGVAATLHVMQSNGGVTTAAQGAPRSRSRRSSPARSGARSAGPRSRARLGRPNLLCVDMGGTSFDLEPDRRRRADGLDRDRARGPAGPDADGRHPHDRRRRRLASPGSRPAASASARRAPGPMPGPACYGRGGTEPTVTDANVLLGRLDPATSSAAACALDDDAAAAALRPVAEQLGLDDTALRRGHARRSSTPTWPTRCATITVKQGIDPRDFALVAFGGAGPMHAGVARARSSRSPR